MHIVQEEIGKPSVSEQQVSDFTSVFTISPLPLGFGHTLGNSLRRTLLSSVPGAGPIAVRIKGVSHEYSSLSGVKESALDLILNIKQLFFKKATKEEEIVVLKKKGEGDVLASDIQISGDTEIINKDFVLTSLDSASDSLEVEIKVAKGIGFSSAKDRQKEEGDDGWILLDTIFSPVKKVSYDVVSTRVGERTNLDSLKIEIETNGGMTPEYVFQFASQILQGYFEFLQLDPEEKVEEDFLADFSSSRGGDDDSLDDQESYTPIEILNLSPRTLNALINGNIGSVEEVLSSTPAQLESMRGFGKKAMTELSEALSAHGYDFGKSE
jgi:DNA-directed RNA polymerase subunit alpha